MTDRIPDPIEALRAFERCPGERLNQDLRSLRTVSRMVGRNSGELLEALRNFGRPEVAFHHWAEDNRDQLQTFHEDVIRLLHNFLASVATLRDHTRTFVSTRYKGQPFEQEVAEEVARVFGQSPLAAFVIGLRNYMLHKELPLTNAVLSMDSRNPTAAGVSSTIRLDRNALAGWKGWKAQARRYVRSLSGDPSLEPIVQDYLAVTNSFYAWFGKRIHELHAEEFSEAERLHRVMTEAWDRAKMQE